MMLSHTNYLYFLPLSAFPVLSSFSSFSMAVGVFLFFKLGHNFLIFSLFSLIFSSMLWWVCYSMEFNEESVSSYNLASGLKFSFLMFILSEVFFFFSFFWSYFHFSLSPVSSLNFDWPPYSLCMFTFLGIPLLNTVLLLSSGVTVTVSHSLYLEGNFSQSFEFLGLTWVLGYIFTFFQLLEYINSFFSWNDSCFGCCFYILTGFHGIHVFFGSNFLMFCFFRFVYLNSCYKYCPLSFELSAWYWHFVDVVWIFLYFFIYVYCFK